MAGPARDLGWHTLDYSYKSSVSHQFARYALALEFDLLPEKVVHQAKRCVLDALGCAIGAYDAPGRPICENVIRELDGPQEATLFYSGRKTSALNATLMNSFLVRYLDYNDMGGGGHNSDSLPALLAISEREDRNGKDFLLSLVISYELGARVVESCATRSTISFEENGWTPDIRCGLNIPPALGKLMRLTEEQIANAIGTSASCFLPLGVLDAHKEENTMSKNLRVGFVAYNSILACMLAKNGFTGPTRVVEGDSGFRETVMRDDMDLERLTDFSGWRILNTGFKTLSANRTTIPHVLATLAIVKENDLHAEDIASVKIRAPIREALHTTTFSKKYPRNAESADHSAFYANAHAIKYRAFGPDAFECERFSDPTILDLIEKITVEPDPDLGKFSAKGISEIVTKDGRSFSKRIDILHGSSDDPLSDGELEDKFKHTASKYLDAERIQEIIDKVWKLETVDDVGELSRLTAVKTPH